MKRAFALMLMGAVLGVAPAAAHHSFDAVFDSKNPVTWMMEFVCAENNQDSPPKKPQ